MLDSYHRQIHYLRISVIDRCNLRCTYCMPEGGVKQMAHKDILTFEEICAIVRKAVSLGFDKFRLTGGEPLIRKGIVNLVKMIASIKGVNDFSMTTNGTLLRPFALPLKKAGLQRVNISLDTLNPDRYTEITRSGNISDVLGGIEAALNAGLNPIKLNCVIDSSPSEPDAVQVARFAEKNGFEIRYIKKMNLKTGEFWGIIGGDGGNCSICNRLRLTSNGMIIPCLFNDICFSVRELGIERALRQAILFKPERGLRSLNNHFVHLGG
jgi:cyclic pyranopterin phosphate synthase